MQINHPFSEEQKKFPDYPLNNIPELKLTSESGYIPSDEECEALWNEYEMLDNIRAHSLVVAKIATALALRAFTLGFPVNVAEVHASALLHDIAKTYCLRYGGGHAQLGSSFVIQKTGNRAIAQGVFHHVYWPWPLPSQDPTRMCSLPFFVMYADKRTKHDSFVNLKMRFDDLYDRYGKTPAHRAGILASYVQALEVEKHLSHCLQCDLSQEIPDLVW